MFLEKRETYLMHIRFYIQGLAITCCIHRFLSLSECLGIF